MPALRKAKSTPATSCQAAASETSNPDARSSDRTSQPSDCRSSTAAAPIPDAPPVTRALRNKNDLSDVAAGLDQLVRCGGLLEREVGADDRADGSPLPEPDELVGGGADDLRRE